MRGSMLRRLVIPIALLGILLSVSMALSQGSKPGEDKGKTKTFAYKISHYCFNASKSPQPGFVPVTAVQELEKKLVGAGKAGFEVIATERLPNLVIKNSQGTPVANTECYMFVLEQSTN